MCGNGAAGAAVGSYGSAQFSEPGGLCVSHDSSKLYVADTNNHCIKIVDLESKLVSQVCHMYCAVLHVVLTGCWDQLVVREAAVVKQVKEKRVAPRGTAVTQLPPLCMRDGITRSIRLHIELPAGCHFTEGATSCWKIVIPEGNVWKCIESIICIVCT